MMPICVTLENTMSMHDIPGDDAQTTSTFSRRTVIAASGAAVAGAGIIATGLGSIASAQDATPAAEEALPLVPPEVEQYAAEWPVAQADLAATRVATGGTIDSSNVATLGVAWELTLDASSTFGAVSANPVVQNGVVYLIDNFAATQAIDLATGEVIWRKDFNVPTAGPNGVALGYGTLISILGDTAEVVALDPATGDERWRFQLANHGALGITMAPQITNGLVIVSTEPGGNTKGTYEGGANGVVYALDIQTGITLWTWDTVEDDLWGNFTVNSGGGLWYPPSVDANGVLYMGIGNAAPFPGTPEYPNATSRPGENDYANNLVALDPSQGKILWNVNLKPRDLFDLDNQQTPVLGTVDIGGVPTDLVYSSGKHGYVAAVDRVSGVEIWKIGVGVHKNDNLQVIPEGESVEVYPGILGGVESPMAFKDGVLYVAAWNFPTSYTSTAFEFVTDAGGYSAATTNLVAIDGATGAVLWDTFLEVGVAGSGPTISGDVLFVGALDGRVLAFNLADGSQIWESQTSAGINAPFAIAGDTLLVPAGSFIAPSAATPDPAPSVIPSLIAYRLGATGTPTLGDPSTASTPATTEGDGIVVTAVDLAFEPKEITIAADTDVEITLVNNGALQHDFVIEEQGVDSGLVEAGGQTTFTVNLPAGSYTFICSVEGHAQAGMVGTLTVE